MGIVVDAGPLISLARIGRLDLLPALFDEIIVPPAVHREVTSEQSLPGAAVLAKSDWLKLVEVADRKAVDSLLSWLDPGEAEVLALALELGATAAIGLPPRIDLAKWTPGHLVENVIPPNVEGRHDVKV